MKDRKKLLSALSKSSSNLHKLTHGNSKAVNASKNKVDKNKSKLAGAKFRWINEKLYTISSKEALKLFKTNPDMFNNYHDGFDTQVQHWPQNPVDIFISKLATIRKGSVVADMGCGTAKIARSLSKKLVVHSFDLASDNDLITVADIANVPLDNKSVDVVVFSLSLMGINYMDFLIEAYRILKYGGELMIAEVTSRFSDLPKFISTLGDLGFKLVSSDDSNKMFILFYFKKEKMDAILEVNRQSLLKPCIYKRR